MFSSLAVQATTNLLARLQEHLTAQLHHQQATAQANLLTCNLCLDQFDDGGLHCGIGHHVCGACAPANHACPVCHFHPPPAFAFEPILIE